MADHIIIQVRDAIIAKLIAGVLAVAGRVVIYDESPTDPTQCPYIAVKIGDDSSTPEALDNGDDPNIPNILEDIQLAFWIFAAVNQDDDPERAAYNLRRDIEATLFATVASQTLDGKVQMISPIAGNNDRDTAGEVAGYNVSIQLQIWIRHLRRLPDSFDY